MARREKANERRDRTRRAREERHGGGTTHKTRVCPSCSKSIPFVEPVQDPPSECGACGFLWDCPECGHGFTDADRDEEGRPPAVCPTCDASVAGGVEADPGAEEGFEWS